MDDNDAASWHSPPGLAVPEGIRLVCLPPPQPELQPVETLWVHLDEPITNRHFDTLADLDTAVARQCVALNANRDRVRRQAGFHWWPARAAGRLHPNSGGQFGDCAPILRADVWRRPETVSAAARRPL